MALSSGSAKMSVYCSNMRQLLLRVCAYSTQVHKDQPFIIYVNKETERRNTLLGPNKQFPFAGDVSSQVSYDHQINKTSVRGAEMQLPKASLSQILDKSANEVKRSPTTLNTEDTSGSSGKDVELKALECPRLLKKDLKELFQGIDLSSREVTVINLSQKTESDMSKWSLEMEIERMQLTSGFVESATSICKILHGHGYWADFIDPASGRPFLGKFTNATLFETDERYRSLGFKITDLGCCKVLEHVVWGTKAFVGTIFTDAPINSSAVAEILSKVNSEQQSSS